MSKLALRVMRSYIHYDAIGIPTIPLNVPEVGFILNPEEWAYNRFKWLVYYDSEEYLSDLYKFLKYIHKIYTQPSN